MFSKGERDLQGANKTASCGLRQAEKLRVAATGASGRNGLFPVGLRARF